MVAPMPTGGYCGSSSKFLLQVFVVIVTGNKILLQECIESQKPQ